MAGRLAGRARRFVLRPWHRRFGRFEQRDGFWLWIGGPVAPGATATTVGRLVLIRPGAEDDAVLVRHEAEHVRQYAELGLVGFLVRYTADYLRWRIRGYGHWAAYRRIGFEIEAEWISRRWARGEAV